MLYSLNKTILWFSFAIALAGCNSLATKSAGIDFEPPGQSNTRQVQIRIAKDGALHIGGEPCDIEALGQRAEELSASAGDSFHELQFNIMSEAGADNALLVGVMYELAKVGITNVSVAADY